MFHRVPCFVCACLLIVSVTLAGSHEASYGVRVTSGVESNPLLVATGDASGAFGEIRVDGLVSRDLTASAAVFIDGNIRGRMYGGSTSDAGRESGAIRVGTLLAPLGEGNNRLLLSMGGRFSAYRGTFTDRETGEVYRTPVTPATDPASWVAVPDRLNHDAAGAFLDARWRQSPALSFFLKTALDRTSYTEDYAENTGLSPLDYRTFTVQPGVSFRLSGAATLGLSVAWTDLDYDARPALDRTGSEVPDVTRNYRYAQYRVSIRLEPARRWDVDIGLASTGRDDTYAGYYDNATHAAYVATDRAIGPKGFLRFHASVRDVDYDYATVSGEPDSQVLGHDERRLVGRFERVLGAGTRWFVEGGIERSDSKDPVFAYDQDWVLGGIQLRR